MPSRAGDASAGAEARDASASSDTPAGPGASDTPADPGRVTPHRVGGTALQDGRLTAVLEPLSWNVIRLA
ncbi:hypothetical protein ACFYNZ_00855 [Streptomyces kebangsaanensis]|uniref:Hydrolase n=1 Tax=Streptomyces kebangsaanensis TaxID=864058 RepID=A0ABW6KJJ9_9ACTN